VRRAVLQRLSAQMAHELNNPLAAIRGAAQWLAADATSHHGDEHRALVALVLEQTDRLARAVDAYVRLARGDPEGQLPESSGIITCAMPR
jgi:nitrogen-specific signal transduction histidine kinase